MKITGVSWLGTRTNRPAEFYQRVPLPTFKGGAGVWTFALPDGEVVEVFAEGHPGKEHLDTGPALGFVVEDLGGAVSELRAAGIEFLGDPGPTWQQFRGPGGNVHQLTPTQSEALRGDVTAS